MARVGGYPELGYTSDPVVLVPGSLSGLRADIDDLTARAEDLALAAEDIARGYVSSWEGETAVAANEHRVALVDALTVNSDLYRVVATVLAGHVDTIRWARARASVAVRLWEQAKALGAVEIRGPATPSSRGGWPPPTPHIVGDGRGADLAEAAQQILAAAREEVRLSAQAAARVMDQFSDGLPDGQFHLDEFLRGIGGWVAGLAGLVWKFNMVRLAVDPGGVVDDAVEMGRGAWDTGAYLLDNPDQAVPVLLDTQTLHDNPGRWWGALFPDLALSAVAGAGAVTRGLNTLRRGVDIVDDLPTRSGLSALAQSKIDMYQRLIDRAGTPDWMRRMFAGSQFDWAQQHRYTANQVWIDHLDGQGNLVGRFRLDSMNPLEEVVSRKLTDLSAVTEATARSYIDEILDKYTPGQANLVVADTPANQAQLGHLDDVIGRPMTGRRVLEVPVQPNGIPQAVLDYATENLVRIRDVTGHSYNLTG
jgi:hypothetical protein